MLEILWSLSGDSKVLEDGAMEHSQLELEKSVSVEMLVQRLGYVDI